MVLTSLAGQASRVGGSGGGGVCFSSTVEVVAAGGAVSTREMNAAGGYFDAEMVQYEGDKSMLKDGSMSFLDALQDHGPSESAILVDTGSGSVYYFETTR
jgi:D-serine deaminase-like pyridoxal phosphate-dependent protein